MVSVAGLMVLTIDQVYLNKGIRIYFVGNKIVNM